jgi:hypothetical protein
MDVIEQPEKPSTLNRYWRDKSLRDVVECELCGGEILEKSCKVRCLNCGFTRDCSDP